jgi:hypothetical protein
MMKIKDAFRNLANAQKNAIVYDYFFYCCTVHVVTSISFIVAPCTLLRVFLLFQLMHTFLHFENTNSLYYLKHLKHFKKFAPFFYKFLKMFLTVLNINVN